MEILAVGGTLSGDGSGLTGVSASSLASDNLTQGDAAVTLSTSSGAVNITPAAGSAIVLDGTINVDAGVVTGATSITTQTQLASTSVQTPLIEFTDGDDAMSIANGGAVTFSQAATLPTGTTVGNLTLANGSITDSGGTIDFDNDNLTTTATVTAEQLTTTDDLTVTDVATIDGTMTISTGSITDSGGTIDFDNDNLTTTATVTAEQLTTTDDLTVTDVATIDGTMTISTGSITDTGGTINFSNENLTTTGTVTANAFSGDGSNLTGVSAGSLASDNLTQGDAAVTLSTSSGAVNITPAAGSAIVLDGTINVDAGVVTGATSITTQTQLASTSVQTPLIEFTDGDDAMSIANGGAVTFSQAATLPTGTTVGNLTLANGSITDSGGTIDFGDENVSTTGTLGAGVATLATGSTVGNLTLANGSITDSGGSISFGDENVSTSGTLASGAQTVTGNVTASGTVTAEQLTTTDDLTVTDVATIDGTVTIATGSITDSGGTINFDNENLTTTGTLGAGVATLATGSTVGNLTLANGSITDSGGSISFGDENVSTSGNITATTSLQTTTIDYTDGTLALTVAADGTVTSSGNVITTGDLTVSGNDIKDNGGSAAITFDGSSNMSTGGTVTTGGSISAGGAVSPSSADGAALGSASKEWSDVFVADGAIINLGDDQDVTLTHVHNDGVILNGDNQFQFRDSDLKIYSSTDGQLDIDANTEVEITTTTLDINGAVDASGDVTVGTSLRTGTIDYTDGTLALTVAANGALTTSGNLAVGGTLSGDGSGLTGVPAGSLASDNLTQGDAAVTLSTSSGAVNITPAAGSAIVLDGTINVDAGVVTGATSLTVDEITSNTGIVPDAADGAYLGTSSAEFSDLFLADGAVVNLGNDQDVTLTHIADTGLLLNVASQLQFRDSDLKVHSSADGQLDIDANTEVEIATTTLDITATTVDINGDVDLVTQATDIDLIDNNSSALSFDANGKAGILEIVTTNSSESVNMSGNIDVDGTTNLDAVDIDGAVQLDATFTVGSDGSGQDVVLYSATAGDNLTWDASAEALIVTGTNGQTALNVADGNLVVADNIDLATDIDVDGTANLDAVDIDGAVQADATVTVGVDDTGYDVKLFGATSGAYALWDESTDDLKLVGGAGLVQSGAGANTLTGATTVSNTLTVGVDDTGYDVKLFGATSGAYALWDESTDDLKLAGGAGLVQSGSGANTLTGATTVSNTLTVGSDGSGQDVVLYSATAGDNLTWDASAEALIVTGTNGQTALNVADGNLVVADNIDLATDIDVDGTANLDAVDIDGAVQVDATVTVGVDDTGYDVKLFGATSGAYALWDESTDDLKLVGGAGLVQSGAGANTLTGATTVSNTLTVGVDDTGYDVKLFGATSGAYALWDESTDDLKLAGGAGLVQSGSGANTLTGATTVSNTLTVGSDGSGQDVVLYSATAGDNLTWDASAEALIVTGTNGQTALNVADGNLVVADNSNFSGTVSLDGSANELRFYESTNYVGFEAPSLSGDQIWVLPSADGNADQVLKTNGSGTLSWTDVSASSIGTLSGATPLEFEGATADAYETSFSVTDPTADRTITIPNVSGTMLTTGNMTSITTTGTVTSGAWTATSIADGYVDNDLTIVGGTINNSVIGASTPAAGTFTALTGTGLDINGNADVSGTTALVGEVTVNAGIIPDAEDGAYLGSSSKEFSDLFLADGSVINLGADQEVTLTHVHNTGVLLNSSTQLQFGDSGTKISQSADGTLDLEADTELELNGTTIDMNGNVDISGTITNASSITSTGAVIPASSDGAALGSTSNEWSDLFVADAGVLNLGDDQEVTLTHVHDTGILLSDNDQFQFRDSDLKVYSSTNGQLDIDADTEVEVTTPTLDINASSGVNISNDLTVGAAINSTGAVLPASANGSALGSAAKEWSDAFFADEAIINMGADQDVTLTHVQDAGVILNGTMKLYFEDGSNTDQYVGSLGSGVTGIAAPTEVDITATTIDLNGDIDLTSQAPDVDLIDNNNSALSFDANGKAGILEIVTTNSSESVKMSGDIDVDGTTNLDAVDIDGAVQVDATVSVGVDDTGYDVKLFGATSGAYALWDESTDDLKLVGGAGLVQSGSGANELTGVTTFNNKTIINSSAEDGGHTVAIPLTNHATYLETGGSGETSTLATGTEGQLKVIVMQADGGGDMVITVSNPGWGGSGTITFDSIGDGVTLQYINSKWYAIGSNGVTFG